MRKLTLTLALALILGIAIVPARMQDEGMPDFIQHTECEHDLTGETITIYHFGDISASYAFITQPLLAGLADAIAYYNAHGGICGAMIATDNRDTAGDRAQAQAAYDYYSGLDPKPDALVLYASGDAELLRTQVEEDRIPIIISAGSVEGLYGEDGATPGWIYATNPLYADQLGSFCEFVGADPMNMYPDEPVIGYIGWGGPLAAFGLSGHTPESVAYCAEQGVTLMETPEGFLPGDDISGQVLNLTDGGANILYVQALASGPVQVAGTIAALGLEEDVQLAGVNWALDTTVGLLGSASLGSDGLPAVNGIVGSLPFRWWSETDNPGIQFITEQAEANERALTVRNIAYILGFTTVDLYTELYIQAVNSAGSLDAVDGSVIKATLDGLDFSPLGVSNLNWEGGKLRATRANRMAMMGFANADMSGLATSGDDALKIPRDDGSNIYVPVLVPLTDFAPAPDLRPGMLGD